MVFPGRALNRQLPSEQRGGGGGCRMLSPETLRAEGGTACSPCPYSITIMRATQAGACDL